MVAMKLQKMRKPLSHTLVGIFAMFILIWACEKNILSTIFLSAQDLHARFTTECSTPIYFPSTNLVGKNEVSPSSSFEAQSNHSNFSFSSTTQACNYAIGRWVAAKNRPLYSGFQCKNWLQQKYACRLTPRPDFSYEGYRWQPENCQMPDFNRFSFLQRMQNRTIAFIGDSLGRQQFQSLMCMATGGENNTEVTGLGKGYSFANARGSTGKIHLQAYRFPKTNTTILFYWSESLTDLVRYNVTDPNTKVAMHLDRPVPFLKANLRQFDVVVLNTGHHWNEGKRKQNRWVIHVNGKRSGDRKFKDMKRANIFAVQNVVKWLDSQIPLHPNLRVFFRTLSPAHFSGGKWNTGGSCDNAKPLSHGSAVVQNRSSDALVERTLKGSKVEILDITALSDLRNEGHISRYTVRGASSPIDCSHWCLPGIPDTWNELLVAQL